MGPMRRWGWLVGAALAGPAFASAAAADEGGGVSARDVLAWRRAGIPDAEILARVRAAPGVERPRVAEVEELAAAGVPAEAVVLLLRRALGPVRGRDKRTPVAAVPAAVSDGPRGTLRVRSRGPALSVTVARDVLTVVPTGAGTADVPAGGARRFEVPAGLYRARLGACPDALALRVVADGASCVVVEAPERLSVAEDVARGRADEDPPRGSPADYEQRRSHESYAARWLLLDGPAIEEHQGTTVSFRRRDAVARVHCDDPRLVCGSLGRARVTVRASAVVSAAGCCDPCGTPGVPEGSCVCPEDRCAAAAEPCPERGVVSVRDRRPDPESCEPTARGVVVREGWVWRGNR